MISGISVEGNLCDKEKSPAPNINLFAAPLQISLDANFTVRGNFCVGDTIYFVNTSDGDYSNIHWDFGDGIDAVAWDSAFHIYQEPGTFNVTLTITKPGTEITTSVSDSATVEITINQSPSVSFTYNGGDDTTVYAGQEMKIALETTDIIDSVTWSTGETGEEISIVNKEGPFEVVVKNQNGCVATAMTKMINIKSRNPENLKIEVENNIITVNNDGMNDVLGIKDIETYDDPVEIVIYDIWGSKVYESGDYYDSGGWRAEEVDAGTYYYHIKSEGKQGITGFVDVIK